MPPFPSIGLPIPHIPQSPDAADEGSSGLAQFLAATRQYNFARANRFEIVLNPPSALFAKWNLTTMRRMSLMVEDGAFPGRTIETSRLRINALSEQRAKAFDYFGEAINFTIYIDDTWNVKEFIEDWQALAIDPDSREIGFYNDYIGSVDITALSVADDVRHTIRLLEAWPRSMQLIQVSQSNSSIHRLVVAIAFKRWLPGIYSYNNNDLQPFTEENSLLSIARNTVNSIIQGSITSLPAIVHSKIDDLGVHIPQSGLFN